MSENINVHLSFLFSIFLSKRSDKMDINLVISKGFGNKLLWLWNVTYVTLMKFYPKDKMRGMMFTNCLYSYISLKNFKIWFYKFKALKFKFLPNLKFGIIGWN